MEHKFLILMYSNCNRRKDKGLVPPKREAVELLLRDIESECRDAGVLLRTCPRLIAKALGGTGAVAEPY
jgi:hypothetical protein